jgi:lipoate-protein ligase B
MRFSCAANWEVQDLSGYSYLEADATQLELVESHDGNKDSLLLCEFDPVLTVGRAADVEKYNHLDLPVVEIPRGGKATFHGPGQLVAYPVLALSEEARDLHAYLHALEDALIRTAGDFGLQASRDSRNTGCWVHGRKLASIGVAVRRWVTYHGVAFNVTTDLDWFRRFDPCGLDPDVMTSLACELETPPPIAEVKNRLAENLRIVLREES